MVLAMSNGSGALRAAIGRPQALEAEELRRFKAVRMGARTEIDKKGIRFALLTVVRDFPANSLGFFEGVTNVDYTSPRVCAI